MGGKWLYRLLLVISVVTVLSGLSQLVRPDLVLRVVGADASLTARHFFAIIGMFMVLFGAMLLQALLTAGDHSVAVLWAAVQKLGAAAAVGLGVATGVFSALALGVALFDLVSGVLIFAYLRETAARRDRVAALAGASVAEMQVR
jgi:hypothetical protein